MGNLFKGVHLLTQSEYNILAENEQLDPDVLYATPENVTELVRLHTEQIAQNTSDILTNRNNISSNTADIEQLKTSSSGQSSEIVDIKNTISEIIIRDTNQDAEIATKVSVSDVDAKIAALVDSAPETLDTLAEVAQAIKDNETVVTALNSAIGSKADKSAVPTSLSQLTTDSTHRLVTDAEKSTWNSKLSSESDPTVPDWAKQATKPEYDYSEIKNAPEGTALYSTTGQNTDGAMTQKATTDALDLKANTADIDFDAIEFAEIEKQKSKNLFRPYEIIDESELTSGCIDLTDADYHAFLAENFYVSYPSWTSGFSAVWFRPSHSNPSRWELRCDDNKTHNIKVTDLKPNTNYTFSFTVKYCLYPMYFLNKYIAKNTATHTNEIVTTFTTDLNGEYVFTNGYTGANASNGGLCEVINIQLEEGVEKTEYTHPYGPVVHGWSSPWGMGETKSNQNDTVVEYWMSSDGKTWYRKWASGWKECGIFFLKSFTNTTATVTFPIEFSNTNYTVEASTLVNHYSDVPITEQYQNRTTNSIMIHGTQGMTGSNIRVCGC